MKKILSIYGTRPEKSNLNGKRDKPYGDRTTNEQIVKITKNIEVNIRWFSKSQNVSAKLVRENIFQRIAEH